MEDFNVGKRFLASVTLPALIMMVLHLQLVAQEQAAGSEELPQSQTTVRTISESVLLDLVIRDRAGRPVCNLTADELEIYENGVRQQVQSFRFVGDDSLTAESAGSPPSKESPRWAGPSATRARFDPFKHVNLVALVFDRLPDTARHMARQAALQFLEAGLQENTLVAVVAIENRLHPLESYSDDPARLREAVLRATSGEYGLFDSQSTDTVQGEMADVERRLSEDSPDAVVGGPGSPPNLVQNREAGFDEVTLNVLRQAERMMLYQKGHITVTSLRALVTEQARLSGRKTIILFSAGIQLPQEVVERYRTLISDANRGNVSIYTVDPRGLHSEDMMADVKSFLSRAINASRAQMLTGFGRMVTREETLIDQHAETGIRMNGYGTLDELARSTGGFLVANTNDPGRLIERVSEDIRTYYEATYRPSPVEYDGKFRAITVKVTRPSVTVQSRSGYFAIPPDQEAPIQGFEVPMLVALNGEEPRADFNHWSRILHFEGDPQNRRYMVVVEVPLATFRFDLEGPDGVYYTRFSVLVLVKDEDGRLVERFAQDYPLQGPMQKLGIVQAGSVVFMRELRLPAGRYTVETAVVDQLAQTVSTRRTRLQVTAPTRGLEMGSMTVVRRVDPLGEGETPEDPLAFQNGRIVPNLAGVVRELDGAGVGVYCVIYPAANSEDQPRMILDVLKNGRVIARGTPDLPKPDANGVIKFAGTVPLRNLDSGRYELRAWVTQGASRVREHAFFQVGAAEEY
jgi:VWFA-related protein